MTDDPDRELDLDGLREQLARRLGVAAHELELRSSGADFHVFVLGDLAIRAPRRPRMLGKLPGERALLDVIASSFRGLVPVPGLRTPAGVEPPSPLFAYRWLAGTPVGPTPPSVALVEDLATFLATLHGIADAPGVRDCDAGAVVQRLQAAVRARHAGSAARADASRFDALLAAQVPAGAVTPCLVHGDLSANNVLVDAKGRLAGVVDWSDSAVTDPAIDFGAIAQWAGMEVVDALLARTGRTGDAALRTRAQMIAGLLDAIDSYLVASFS